MKRFVVAVVLAASAGCVSTIQQRNWQAGYWRDSTMQVVDGGSVTIPIGGTPPSTIAGVTNPGTPPMYFNIPNTGTAQTVVIEGLDGMVYVAVRSVGRPWPVIVNDRIVFAVENDRLYTHGDGGDPTREFWFKVVKRVRTKPAD